MPQTGLPPAAKLRSSGMRPQRSATSAMVVLSPAPAAAKWWAVTRKPSRTEKHKAAKRTAGDYQPVDASQLLFRADFNGMHAWQLAQAGQVLPERALQRQHAYAHLRRLAGHSAEPAPSVLCGAFAQ